MSPFPPTVVIRFSLFPNAEEEISEAQEKLEEEEATQEVRRAINAWLYEQG